MRDYERPSITVLGTIQELTLGGPFDKIGGTADAFTAEDPEVDGSIVPD